MSLILSFLGNRRGSNYNLFSMDIWDPFRNFLSFSHEHLAFVNTWVDWKETLETYVFKVDLSRLKKEEVKVEIKDDRVLQISRERNMEKETWRRKTRITRGIVWSGVVASSQGKLSKSFRLPENMKINQVKALMDNGVLTVTVPKVEVKKPNVKTIQIFG